MGPLFLSHIGDCEEVYVIAFHRVYRVRERPHRTSLFGCAVLGYTAISMTKLLRFDAAYLVISLLFAPALVGAQNPPQKPQPVASFMAPPQVTAGDQHNFPPLLLQQL